MADKIDNVRQLLKITYGLVPIIAGLDKFLNILVDWDMYLSPDIAMYLPISASAFIAVIGIIEIIAGIIVLSPWTVLGAYIVSIWLILISLNLIILGRYDIAVRDITMAIGAFSLAKISEFKEK